MTQFIPRKWTLTAGTFVFIGALMLLRLYMYNHTAVLKAHVDPQTLAAGEPLTYTDASKAATSWRWEFGEGSISTEQQGVFRYQKPGTYLVRLTVNNRLSNTFTVRVKLPQARYSSLQLVGPTEGYQQEKLTFQTVGGNARKYAWKFGESGQVDASEPAAIYAYSKPGTYTVEVRADNGPPLRQLVRIVSRYGSFTKLPPAPAADIRWRLQRIANGSQVNRQYQYLLNKYLCGQANVPVVVGELPPRDFYAYCMNLQFDPGWTIDSVALLPPGGAGCVSKLTILQHKNQ